MAESSLISQSQDPLASSHRMKTADTVLLLERDKRLKKKISVFKIQSSLHRKDPVELWAEIQHMVYSAQEMVDVTEFKFGM